MDFHSVHSRSNGMAISGVSKRASILRHMLAYISTPFHVRPNTIPSGAEELNVNISHVLVAAKIETELFWWLKWLFL